VISSGLIAGNERRVDETMIGVSSAADVLSDFVRRGVFDMLRHVFPWIWS
jgi:hypothetical protein